MPRSTYWQVVWPSSAHKPAVVNGGESISYGDLAVRVSRFAGALREAGMKPGDRVALFMLDHADLVSMYLAVIAAGGVAVAISTRATGDDLRTSLLLSGTFAVIAESDFAPAITTGMAPNENLLSATPSAVVDAKIKTEFVPCVRRPDDPAYWVMTSGTTGQPKAVEHRHDNVFACTDYLVRGLAATSADRFFPTSRLNFAYALGAMFGALRLGATLILHEGWPTPPSVAATVELNRRSTLLSVPTLFQRLCECGSPSKLAFRAVRCYVSAGERLPPRSGPLEKASGRPIIDAMSCSELIHKIFANTLSARRAGSSGRPVPGVEVRLIDTDGSEITQSGRSGQLEVRASFLCAGYRLDDTQSRAAAHRPTARFRGEWFATGDEYLRDEDGFYHHCGRSDDMLKTSGLWVSPSEIEDMLAGIPTVREAAAVLREGSAGLSEIVLYIVATSSAEGGAAIAAARAQLTRNLPAFKLPRQYALAAQLPRTPSGKIQRYKLRAELQRSA